MLRSAGRFVGKVTFKLSKMVVKTGWKTGKTVVGTGVSFGKRTVRKSLKQTVSKVNPINKRVNKADVADHGVESLRMANYVYKTGKKTIQTTKTTIQTTEKTIKLAENTAKTTYRTTKSTVVTTYRVTKAVVVFIKNAVIVLITAASSPVFWILAAIAVVMIVLISAGVALLGGAADFTEQMRQLANDPVALTDDIPEDIEDAVEYFRIACENQKTEFHNMVNGYYYDRNNLRESDLVYMRRNNPPAEFQKSYATDHKKEQIRNAWNVSVIEPEALAIVYVLLERAENEASGTEMELYPIEYTQEAFDDLLDTCCAVTEDVYERQECLTLDCSEEFDEQPNPQKEEKFQAYQTAVNKYNSFYSSVSPLSAEYRRRLEIQNAAPDPAARSAMQSWVDAALTELTTAFRSWESNYGYTGWEINEYMDINCQAWLGTFVETAQSEWQNTPDTIRTPRPVCAHEHHLHSVGLNIFNAAETMNRYHFTEAEILWAESLTQTYSAYFQYLEEGGG